MKIGVNFVKIYVHCCLLLILPQSTHCIHADPRQFNLQRLIDCVFIFRLTHEVIEGKRTISFCSKQVFSVPFEEKRFKNFNTFGNGELDRQNSAIRDVMTKTSTTIEVCNAKDQSLTILVTGKIFGCTFIYCNQV